MKRYVNIWQLAVIIFCAICFAVPEAGAAVRRVPSPDLVTEGILNFEIEAEGAKDFRFKGEEGKYHTYIGQMKPGEKIRITFTENLGSLKSLPQYKKRSCTAKCDIVAKKGGNVLEKKNFSRENKSNVRVEYTVPKDADTVEMVYTFELKNYKTNGNGVRCRMTSKLIFTADKVPPMALTTKESSSGGGMLKTLLGIAGLGVVGFGAIRFLRKRKAEVKTEEDFNTKQSAQTNTMTEQEVMEKCAAVTCKTSGKKLEQKLDGTLTSIAEAQAGKARFCTECGAKLQQGAAFCTECGHKLN